LRAKKTACRRRWRLCGVIQTISMLAPSFVDVLSDLVHCDAMPHVVG
jgi:hypothetical protein